jgi:transmembrane sensor
MINYEDFKREDWITDPDFQQWVFHSKADAFWQAWIGNHPLQQADIEQAKRVLLAIRGELIPLSENEIKKEVTSLMRIIPDTDDKQFPWWQRRPLQVAAGLLLVIGLGWGVMNSPLIPHHDSYHTLVKSNGSSDMIEQVNTTDQVKSIALPDGSTIVLSKNSRISYPNHFAADRREVFLLGEAFFDITKNPERPFYVYANELITKVLGTSFTIKAYEEDKQVSVAVKSGKVSVYTRETKDLNESSNPRMLKGLIIQPNQQAVLARKNLDIKRSVVEQPVVINKTPTVTKNFSFKRTSASEVFEEIEKAYEVDIIFDKDIVSDCSITAELSDESLFEKLNMLCTVMNASYQSVDGHIILNAQPCK